MKSKMNFFNSGLIIATIVTFNSCSEHKKDSPEMDKTSISKEDTTSVMDTYRNSLNIDNDSLNMIVWAEDARWLQAFGRVFHGRDTIINFTRYLQKLPGYAVSKVGRQDEPEIIFIRPDVAILHEYHEREGQIINSIVTPTRKINTTYIMSKENGYWKIRDKVTMDERVRPQRMM